MLEVLEAIKEQLDVVTKSLSEYLKNDEIDLVERWSVYCKACSMGVINKSKSYYYNCPTFDKYDLTMYDDFCVDRYQTISFEEYVEQLEGHDSVTDEDIVVTMSDILAEQSEYCSFRNDW